jgi:hypothetical protein
VRSSGLPSHTRCGGVAGDLDPGGASQILADDGAGHAEVPPLLGGGSAAILRTIQMEHSTGTAIVAGEAGDPELPLLKLGLVGGSVLIVGPVVLGRRLRGPLALGVGHPEPAFRLRNFS